MGVIHSIVRVKSKLEDRIIVCMFLGYALNHMDGTYLTLNICMKHVVLIYDIIWLNKTCGKYVSRL